MARAGGGDLATFGKDFMPSFGYCAMFLGRRAVGKLLKEVVEGWESPQDPGGGGGAWKGGSSVRQLDFGLFQAKNI